MTDIRRHCAGFTLAEVLVTVVILGLILIGVAGVLENALSAESATRERNDLNRQARFALDRMTASVAATRRLLVPLAENPATGWSESTRDPGVLAVTLDPGMDRDADGWADGNNDKDFLDLNQNAIRDPGEPERIDEDPPNDVTFDTFSGVAGIDDDGDGLVDEAGAGNDDEDNSGGDEDWVNGNDDDGDGAVDEDHHKDANADGAPGVAGVDDDLDGLVDEGPVADDDEDGVKNEDWLDVVVYFVSGKKLIERMPNVNPVDGNDFSERVIADNVSRFRVERIPEGAGRAVLVDITLGLTGTHAEVEFSTRVRVGAGS